jgi:alpha-1,4-digalacturonate transport system permease protein
MLKYALLIIICAVLLFPLWLMVSNSFSESKQFLRAPPRVIPAVWTLANYKQLFSIQLLGRWVANTLFIVAATVVAGVIVNGAAGYAFAYGKGKWLTILFWLMMTPIFVTRIVLLIAQFVVVNKLAIRGTPAVILMSVFWATGIFLFRNYFRGIPISIIESAKMDGAGEWAVLLRIVLPIAKPIVGAAIVFLGMGALGDYVWQMLNLQQAETQTFIVGLIKSATYAYSVKNVGYELAIGVFLFIPYLILFSLSSKYFIKGLANGAIKE